MDLFMTMTCIRLIYVVKDTNIVIIEHVMYYLQLLSHSYVYLFYKHFTVRQNLFMTNNMVVKNVNHEIYF